MKKLAVIVEGKGDVQAVPSLIARTARAFQTHVIACDPPVRAGEARKLMRQGELERYLRLAASREDAEEVLLLIDLDDDCAVTVSSEFNRRAEVVVVETGKRIHICFV